jgi:uncharacterized protein DUF4197
MKKIISVFFLFFFLGALPCYGGFLLDGFFRGSKMGGGLNPSTTGAGLREALAVGTENAVSLLSSKNGYFSNEAVKILVPEKIQNVAETLKKSGFEQKVDDFVLSMNRAAEKAAPQAKGIYIDAIMGMIMDDARGLFEEGNTAATDYLKSKSYNEIYDAYKPIVSSSLDQTGGTAAYNDMMKTFSSLPLMTAQPLDLSSYVTTQALEGIFHMVGQEEIKIRTDPEARVTDLLKDIFGE